VFKILINEKILLYDIIFATTVDGIGVALFDCYSIAYLTLGIGIFLFLSLFYTVPKSKGQLPIFTLLFVFILTMLVLIAFKIIEILFFSKSFWIFVKQAEVFRNILNDLILGGAGGFIMWLSFHLIFEKKKKIWTFYIYGSTVLIVSFITFIVLLYLTNLLTIFELI
jgi:hypothetical protein